MRMLRVTSPTWRQEWYDTAGGEAGRRAATLRRLGYRVHTGRMGPQITPLGRIALTLVTIRPGIHGSLDGLPE